MELAPLSRIVQERFSSNEVMPMREGVPVEKREPKL